jgi:ribosome-binding protein aMBF1 (putative translation factor)
VARTQAVYYRDSRGGEPVGEFIQALPPKRAAKIDDFIEEHLNGRPPQEPPAAFPITSQIEGELRELGVRSRTLAIASFTNVRRIWWCSCTRSRRTPEQCPGLTSSWPSNEWRTSSGGWMRSGAPRRGPRAGTRQQAAQWHQLIKMDKLVSVSESGTRVGPRGIDARKAAEGRARRSQDYRAAREEYAAIRRLREKNWIAAHIRERRYELDLTQQEVAQRAGTSHSFISRLESGEHIPTIPVLKRILGVLDEQLLIGIERATPEDERELEIAPVPEVVSA